MTDSKDHSLAISQDRAPLPQKPSSRRCQMFCKPSKEGEPIVIDYYITHENQGGKSPEECFAKGLGELTGTENKELAEHIIWQGVLAIPKKDESDSRNIVFQTLAEQQPKDPHEARLCIQAMALYTQGMKYIHRSEQESRIPQSEFYMKNAMKLLRLHNETIEAINKHRRGGDQCVVVQHQHVQVNNGGKAIVSNNIEISGGQ